MPDSQPTHPTAPRNAGTSPRPQVLMLVADAVLDGVYRSNLQSEDFCIVWCEDRRAWKEALLGFRYDLIVMDFSFFDGGKDGIERLHEVMKLSPDSEVVVLSDSEDARVAITAFHMGVADYFLKPVNPETLIWALKKAARMRAIRLNNELLSEDMRLFDTVHQLTGAETDTAMRTLVGKQLLSLVDAEGVVWISGDESRREIFGSEPAGKQAVQRFQAENPGLVPRSFESSLTGHPEQWLSGERGWIPLRFPWMGGFFIHGVKRATDEALQSRLEFLIRNLEAALENHQRYVQARKLSYIDDLTGLYNGRYLEAAVAAAIERYEQRRVGFSVLFVDIDRFKSVNDQNGHLVGSALLVELARMLKKTLRRPDHLFRYGGDEFIILLYDADRKEALRSAERLRREVENHVFCIGDCRLRVTLSIGVATVPDHATDKTSIIRMADEAMYTGKKSGRNAVFLAALPDSKKAA